MPLIKKIKILKKIVFQKKETRTGRIALVLRKKFNTNK